MSSNLFAGSNKFKKLSGKDPLIIRLLGQIRDNDNLAPTATRNKTPCAFHLWEANPRQISPGQSAPA